jgi:hypothetical protein
MSDICEKVQVFLVKQRQKKLVGVTLAYEVNYATGFVSQMWFFDSTHDVAVRNKNKDM